MDMMQMALNSLGMSQANGLVLAITVVIGVLELLYGYRLIKLFIFLIGFLVAMGVSSLFADPPITIVIGLVVGALLVVCWYLGIFLLGAVLGVVAAVLLGANDRIVVSIFAVVGGLLAISIRKLFLIISTSFSGAYMLSSALASSIERFPSGAMIAITVVLAIVGIWFQYRKSSAKAQPDAAKSTPTPVESAPTSSSPDSKPESESSTLLSTNSDAT